MARATRVPYLVSGTNEYGSSNSRPRQCDSRAAARTEVAARRLHGREGLHPAWTDSAVERTRRTQTTKGERHGEGPATWQSRSQEAEEGKGQGDRGGAEPEGSRLAAGFRVGEKEVARSRSQAGESQRSKRGRHVRGLVQHAARGGRFGPTIFSLWRATCFEAFSMVLGTSVKTTSLVNGTGHFQDDNTQSGFHPNITGSWALKC